MSKDYVVTLQKCIYCGDEIHDYPGHKICYGCVVDEIYETIAAGKIVTQTMRSRARYKGIDVKEIRKEVQEDAKIQEQKNCS